jgi:hypothetical protein
MPTIMARSPTMPAMIPESAPNRSERGTARRSQTEITSL